MLSYSSVSLLIIKIQIDFLSRFYSCAVLPVLCFSWKTWKSFSKHFKVLTVFEENFYKNILTIIRVFYSNTHNILDRISLKLWPVFCCGILCLLPNCELGEPVELAHFSNCWTEPYFYLDFTLNWVIVLKDINNNFCAKTVSFALCVVTCALITGKFSDIFLPKKIQFVTFKQHLNRSLILEQKGFSPLVLNHIFSSNFKFKTTFRLIFRIIRELN